MCVYHGWCRWHNAIAELLKDSPERPQSGNSFMRMYAHTYICMHVLMYVTVERSHLKAIENFCGVIYYAHMYIHSHIDTRMYVFICVL